MKALKNDRASYKTRAAIGSPKSNAGAKSAAMAVRTDFSVDRAGYFVWSKSPKTSSGKKSR